jgi:hypothetical protein
MSMSSRHIKLANATLFPLALGWLFAGAACIQPDEQTGADFGAYRGSAVATYDAGASHDDGDPGTAPAGDGSAAEGAQSGDGASGHTGDGVSGGSGAPTTSPEDGGSSAGGEPTTGTPGGSDSSGGTSGGDAIGDGGATGSGSGGGVSSFSFSVVTTSLGGKYAPRNIGAIWITDGAGNFVKTLKVWADRRLGYLTTFHAQTGRNQVDAVTSATLSSFGTRTVTWDLKDLTGEVVPDGSYNVVMEHTDYNGAGESTSVAFAKGSQPVDLSPADSKHFTRMSLRIQ